MHAFTTTRPDVPIPDPARKTYDPGHRPDRQGPSACFCALGLPGGGFHLFVAGLGGGAALAEAAEALERRDAAREQEEVLCRKRELRDRVSAIKERIHSTRAPALRAATAVGSAFAMRNTNPDSEDAAFLGVSDEPRSAHDANDTFEPAGPSRPLGRARE